MCRSSSEADEPIIPNVEYEVQKKGGQVLRLCFGSFPLISFFYYLLIYFCVRVDFFFFNFFLWGGGGWRCVVK